MVILICIYSEPLNCSFKIYSYTVDECIYAERIKYDTLLRSIFGSSSKHKWMSKSPLVPSYENRRSYLALIHQCRHCEQFNCTYHIVVVNGEEWISFKRRQTDGWVVTPKATHYPCEYANIIPVAGDMTASSHNIKQSQSQFGDVEYIYDRTKILITI